MPRKKKDLAEKQTDALLDELEKRIVEEYETALKGVQEKYDRFAARFAEEEKEKKKLFDDGKITFNEFMGWKRSKILSGDKYKQLLNTLASDLAMADQKAMSIANGYMPEAYALNFNYTTYEIEMGVNANTGFALYSRETVEKLVKQNEISLPKRKVDIPLDQQWNRKHLDSAILQGVLQGDSIPKISKRLQQVTDMDRKASIRNARTMMTGAQNGGRMDAYARADSLGIKIEKEWMATLDNRTRDSHQRLDGERVPWKKVFSNGLMYPGDPDGRPEEVYNCFIGETKITTDSNIIRSYKHEYEGELVEIKTASGVDFTCTPNHPVLSDRGWVKVASLNQGDNLLIARFRNKTFTRRDPHIYHVHSRMDALHELFDKFFGERIRTLSVNFHGDIPTSKVEVVTLKGFLRNNFDLSRCKPVNKFLFKLANKTFAGDSTFMKHFRRVWLIAFSFVGFINKFFTIISRCLRHSQIHRFRTIARDDTSFVQTKIDGVPATSEFFGECFDGHSVEIFADNIISIDRRISKCHVYNLQTENGRYFANSSISKNGAKDNGIYAIVHNCRCTMVPFYPDFESAADKRITYQEWAGKHDTTKEVTEESEFLKRLKTWGIQYNEVQDNSKKLSENEIIEKLGGGDMTAGSCSSLTFAYAGQHAGYDVLDFRGGESCSFFSKTLNIKEIASLPNVKSVIVKNTNDFIAVNEVIKNMVANKDYILSTGKHNAIIRKNNDGILQYLELQSSSENGWIDFERDYVMYKGWAGYERTVHRTMDYTLKNRFGCQRSHSVYGEKMEVSTMLIDVESLRDNDEFKEILGYINTNVNEQKKGKSGSVK